MILVDEKGKKGCCTVWFISVLYTGDHLVNKSGRLNYLHVCLRLAKAVSIEILTLDTGSVGLHSVMPVVYQITAIHVLVPL